MNKINNPNIAFNRIFLGTHGEKYNTVERIDEMTNSGKFGVGHELFYNDAKFIIDEEIPTLNGKIITDPDHDALFDIDPKSQNFHVRLINNTTHKDLCTIKVSSESDKLKCTVASQNDTQGLSVNERVPQTAQAIIDYIDKVMSIFTNTK